ncbi:hypothetical protein HMPREF9453_01067 [Dialister succinatiphilus YIT 11850]|uniref:Uncharacterized protein n=1 Tax=Dialister succinatiphilus YIT 11850 TaxID=742743 RepID=H1D0C9_9FIRM|nr:hypothetical protein HMPREF9453_01067 [Dialister succinatiphilus YIT 11850]
MSLFFLGRSPVVRFYHKRAPSINVRRPQQPSAAEPLSNLRTLGAIAPSNFRTLKPHRGLSIRRLYGFRRQRRYKKWRQRRRTSPVGTVSQPIGKPFNGQAKGLLWLTWRSYAGPPQYFIPPEGGALNPPVRRSRSQAEPWQPRARGPAAASTLTPVRACQPSGILESTAMAASAPISSVPRRSRGADRYTLQ